MISSITIQVVQVLEIMKDVFVEKKKHSSFHLLILISILRFGEYTRLIYSHKN